MSLDTVGLVHSRETFGTVDGPGVRYVLFLQGCPMRCLYCHNPDTWASFGGTETTVREVLEDYEKYRPFLKDGGITLSGGEATVQMDFVLALFEACQERGIHTCLDTCGVLFNEDNPKTLAQYEKLREVTDLVMLDIKHINPRQHKVLTGHSNENILKFLKFMDDHGMEIWIRHVILPRITYNKDFLYQTGQLLGNYDNITAIDVLPYHTMGVDKYKELGFKYPLEGVEAMTNEQAMIAKNIILLGRKDTREKLGKI